MNKLKSTNTEDKITKYRNIILEKLYNNPIIIDLLGGLPDGSEDASDIIWERIYPMEIIPQTTKIATAYICIDVVEDDNPIDTFKDIHIYFFVSAHYSETAQRTPKGLRCDRIVHEIEKIFNDQFVLGLGKCRFGYNHIYSPDKSFRGRVVEYSVFDCNYGV